MYASRTHKHVVDLFITAASLDFSVLDPDPENGVTAPASADLPLLSGGPRDRAYSFECFAFGINADEPLPDYGEQSGDANDEGNYSGAHGRQRGDSIIFDPASFQEGGIHEEHALTTRERRGISIDLDSIVSSMPVPSSAPSAAPASEATATASSNYNASTPSQVLSSARAPSAAPPIQPKQTATNHSASYTTAGAQGSNRPQNGYQHPYPNAGATPSYSPSHVPSNVNGSNGFLSGAVAATSQTFQMELLNKDGRIGIYLPEARRERIARFHAKRKMRIWRKRIKYDCRKKLADSRPRIKGRFVKRSDMDD